MEQEEPLFIDDVNEKKNDIATLKDILTFFFHTTKHILNMQISNHAAWYFPIKVLNICPHKNFHTDTYDSFIHYCKTLKATKISFIKWSHKWIVKHQHSETFFSVEKKWATRQRQDMKET